MFKKFTMFMNEASISYIYSGNRDFGFEQYARLEFNKR